MSKFKRVVLPLAALLFIASVAFALSGVEMAHVAVAAENSLTDITDTGVDFITSVPENECKYKAGTGTLTYVPASDGNVAQIIFEDAEIYAGTMVNYWSANRKYAAVAAKGNVELVLKGNSRVYMRSYGSNAALLFYDSNVTVTGDGSLVVGYRDGTETVNLDAYPMEVMANNDILVDEDAYAESGNFKMISGTLSLNGLGGVGQGSLDVSNRIEVVGGILQTYGQMAGIRSVNGNIEIAGGNVRVEDFNEYGILARNGDVTISGCADVYVGGFKRVTSVGISGGEVGNEEYSGNIYIKGGKTKVEVPYLGIFAQGNTRAEDGKIEVVGGEVDVNVYNGTLSVGAAIGAMGNGADIVISGGNVKAVSGGANEQISVGLYAERNIKIDGGKVFADAENKTKTGEAIGAYALKGIYFNDGAFEVCGDSSAIGFSAPHTMRNAVVTAATDKAGKNTTEYSAEDFEMYKYLKFESGEILSVFITPMSGSVQKGAQMQFVAEVKGSGVYNSDVIWSINGADSAGTKIDANGRLTVAADETAVTLTVTAVSAAAPEKSASAVVTVTANAGDENVSEPAESGGKFTSGEIAALTVGTVAGTAIVAFIVYYIVRKIRK